LQKYDHLFITKAILKYEHCFLSSWSWLQKDAFFMYIVQITL